MGVWRSQCGLSEGIGWKPGGLGRLERALAYWAGMRTEMVLGRSHQPLICCTIRMKMRWPTGSSLNLAR